MFKNYFLIGLRHVMRSPLLSALNILGMVLGITCSTIIFIYVWRERDHDRYYSKADNLYRITVQQNGSTRASTPGLLAPEIKALFPEVVNTARLGKWSGVLKTSEALFSEDNLYFADRTLLEMFDVPLVQGDLQTVLTQPNHILLSETMAAKYFGNEWRSRNDVIGTTLRLNNETDFIAVGIFRDLPSESSLRFDFLLSFEHLVNDRWTYNWTSYNFYTFVELAPGYQAAAFEEKIKGVLAKRDPQAGFMLGLQSVRDMYLHPLDFDYWIKRGNRAYIQLFGIIGLGILLIACFNFINLTTAQTGARAKEVGIRKTIGASRAQIFAQFLGESAVVVLTSIILARGLVDLTLPYFSTITGTELALTELHFSFSVLLLSFTLLVGFFASVYPATKLARMNAVASLKGITRGRGGKTLREGLVVTQFFLSFLLLMGTVVIYRQLQFMQTKELGFDKDQLMFIELRGVLREKNELFREELVRQAEVAQAASTTSIFVNNENYSQVEWEGQLPGQELTITQMNADPYVIPLMGMALAHGRNFSVQTNVDTASYIINETAARQMGYREGEAIGKRVVFWGVPGVVIGVVNDFNFRPLSVGIEPFIMRYQPETFYFDMLVKVQANQVAAFIEKLPALYQKYDAENPLSYGFVDEHLQQQYLTEQRALSLASHFGVLSVVITCLGLFGLAAFMAAQRTKEIGVRKVLGGSIQNMIVLLSLDFLRPMVLALVMGTSLAWYLLTHWLSGYAYRTELAWWVFAAVGLLSMTVAWLTVSAQAIKTAMANPVDSLRNE